MSCLGRRFLLLLAAGALGATGAIASAAARAEFLPLRGGVDGRIRSAAWREEEVFDLHGRIGYQIDLQFESGEIFVGLAAGDMDALGFVAEGNHLFLKPRAKSVHTNITVLTSRRLYQFDYSVSADSGGSGDAEVIYALRFTYPPRPTPVRSDPPGEEIEARLRSETAARTRNLEYWYCGSRELRPVEASDDGLQTRLRFAGRGELPAVYVRNADGTESLLNFHVEADELVLHRVSRQFMLRRGRLTGCVVNKGFRSDGDRASSGTLVPGVERVTEGRGP